jgi:hypothetical protein
MSFVVTNRLFPDGVHDGEEGCETIRLIEAEWDRAGDELVVPVAVSIYVPGTAEQDTFTVNADVAELPAAGVTEAGLNVAVTPAIDDEVLLRPTEELNPLTDPMVMVDVP